MSKILATRTTVPTKQKRSMEAIVRSSSIWMTSVDERILENLRDEEELTVWMIAEDLDMQTGIIRDRCRTLVDAGFLYRLRRGRGEHEDMPDKFGLSIWGRLYLLGDVDADLRRPVPGPRPPYAVELFVYMERCRFGNGISR